MQRCWLILMFAFMACAAEAAPTTLPEPPGEAPGPAPTTLRCAPPRCDGATLITCALEGQLRTEQRTACEFGCSHGACGAPSAGLTVSVDAHVTQPTRTGASWSVVFGGPATFVPATDPSRIDARGPIRVTQPAIANVQCVLDVTKPSVAGRNVSTIVRGDAEHCQAFFLSAIASGLTLELPAAMVDGRTVPITLRYQ